MDASNDSPGGADIPAGGKFEHVSFMVKDLREAAQDFNDIFGIHWILMRNDHLGQYLGASDNGLVLSQEIDPENPTTAILYEKYLTAIEVKVPDLDLYHQKVQALGATPYLEMHSIGGFHEFIYDKDSFHQFPLVVNSYPSDSLLESTGSETPEGHSNVVWNWFPGHSGWNAKGQDYSRLSDVISGTGDCHVVRVALFVPSNFERVVDDFTRGFDMEFTVVTSTKLGLRIALSDQGYQFCETLDASTPSPLVQNFGENLVAAVEIRGKDMDEVDTRLLAKGVKKICEFRCQWGYRAYYYDSSAFHNIPLLIAESVQQGFLQAIQPGLAQNPQNCGVDIKWS